MSDEKGGIGKIIDRAFKEGEEEGLDVRYFLSLIGEQARGSPEPLKEYLEKNTHIFTLVGVFAAVSIYMSRASQGVEAISPEIRGFGLVIGLALSGVLASIVFFELFDIVLFQVEEHSFFELFWFLIFGFLFSLLGVLIIAVIGSFPEVFTALLLAFILTMAYFSFLKILIYAREHIWTDSFKERLDIDYWTGGVFTSLSVFLSCTILLYMFTTYITIGITDRYLTNLLISNGEVIESGLAIFLIALGFFGFLGSITFGLAIILRNTIKFLSFGLTRIYEFLPERYEMGSE